MDTPHRRQPLASPARFPVYGLPPAWVGRRAIDTIAQWRGSNTEQAETYGLWLGHYDDETATGARVGTFDHELLSAAMGPQGEDAGAAAARIGIGSLIDLTMPGSSDHPVPKPPPAPVKMLVRRAAAPAELYDAWPTTVWIVDDIEVVARSYAFGGGWTGYASTEAGTVVVVVALGLPPESLDLVTVRDGGPYGFVVGEPLDRNHAREQTRDWYETILAKPNLMHWHRDYVDLADQPSAP